MPMFATRWKEWGWAVRQPGAEIHAFVRLFAQFGAPEYHVMLGPADPTYVASSDWPAQSAESHSLHQ
jgi:hypothetical protein